MGLSCSSSKLHPLFVLHLLLVLFRATSSTCFLIYHNYKRADGIFTKKTVFWKILTASLLPEVDFCATSVLMVQCVKFCHLEVGPNFPHWTFQACCHLRSETSYLCISGSTCTTRCWWALCRCERRRIWRRHRSTARSCPGRGSWSLIGRAAGRSWCPGERTSNPGGPYKSVTSRPRTLPWIRARWSIGVLYSHWFLWFLFCQKNILNDSLFFSGFWSFSLLWLPFSCSTLNQSRRRPTTSFRSPSLHTEES